MQRLALVLLAFLKCTNSQINPINYNPDITPRPTWSPNYNQNNNFDPNKPNNINPDYPLNPNRDYDRNTDFNNRNTFNNPQFNNKLTPTSPNINPFNTFNRDRDDDWNRQNSLNQYDTNTAIIKEATYFVVASRMVRPGQIYKVAVTVFKTVHSLAVRCSIQRNRVELSTDLKTIKEGIPETLIMRVPPTSVPGVYKLRVEGIYDGMLGGIAFLNETELTFSQRSMTIFIQTDKPVYMQGQTVRFRTIPINTELRAFDSTVDVYILDPKRNIMRRWLSRQSNLGTVSLQYQLSDQPVFGEWIIQSIAQGQVEEATFLVEEYYQTRYEVNVTMPAFFFNNAPYFHGRVMANYTSGGPVRGNLTLKATIRPLGRFKAQPYEKYFNFNEQYPFWFPAQNWEERTIPHLKFFYGVYDFKYPMSELIETFNSPEGMEVTITASVGDRFLNDIISGYSIARIYNNSIKAFFLGGSPQVFKPAMPIDCYVTVSYHDNSPLSKERLRTSQMELTPILISRNGQRNFAQRALNMSNERSGVWHFKFDLKNEIGYGNQGGGSHQKIDEIINDVTGLKLTAVYRDSFGYPATTELNMLTHFSLTNRYLKVYTSTEHAKVGEYIILHVQANFYLDSFDYLVMSKGTVLITSQETMTSTIRTIAVPLSAEMAPVATVVVYHVGHGGDVIADSLTFPVNGISRNNFTVYINNRKARTGERVEIAIYGEPGAYVGLSGIDRAFYSMQAGNELTYAQVITKMARFDEQTNGTHLHRYISHAGDPDEIVYFPSSTFGIDANRTFEYAGLVVFTDVVVPRRSDLCNRSMGLLECLNGHCYRMEKKCDGMRDCEDGTDESDCHWDFTADLTYFRKNRFSRIQRQYEHVWLWKDVNIGPHGRYIFEVDVPKRPAHWMVSAFSVSPAIGFGMLQKSLEYVGELPFFINVEMPNICRQGEQLGIRVTVFNYQTSDIEATVVLEGSKDYKFVHVEMNGIVRSYNPRTSFGEHQFFIWIRAQDATVVHIPIVPTRLGDMEVTVHAATLIGKDSITRKFHVEADGLPQHRHQSILLDLRNRAYIFQYLHVNITETPIIPYDENRYYVFGSNKAFVSVVGDVVGPIFPTMPVNASSLLHLPQDSAEQTLFSFAANMYTTLFMRLINQRNRTLERESFYHMNIGYQRALSFMNPDGSFSLFRSDWNHSTPSVWLTAFCARMFQEASFYEWENFIYIDPQVIAKSVSWILKHQSDSGAFYEVTWLPDRKMNLTGLGRDQQNRNRNISLTAHVLITLEVVKDLTGGLGAQVSNAQKRAIHWLEWNLKNIETQGEPYEVAIVAYALLLSQSAIAETAFGILAKHARVEGGLMYWGKDPVPQPPYKIENQKPFSLPRLPYKYDAINVEATAYALLTYVARQELMIDPIVKWLNSQRLTDGGWASTQDSIVAMKALMEYTIRSRLRDVSSLTISIEATALKGKTKTLHVTNKNIARLQKIEIPEAWGTVKVQAKGAGYAILQMSVQYNVDIRKFQTEPPVRAFSLKTRANFHGRNQSHITYLSCQRWTLTQESERSGMAVLDITIPTGYIIQQQTLDAYIRSRQVHNLHRARFYESKVIFYFNYLEPRDTCINFTIERWLPVANMSRYLPIRVYDYYAPERFNETIFDSLSTYLLNICEVCGSSQCPYCPIYNVASAMMPALVMFLPLLLLLRQWISPIAGSLFLAVT